MKHRYQSPLVYLKHQYIVAQNQYTFDDYNAGTYSGTIQWQDGDCGSGFEMPAQVIFDNDPNDPYRGIFHRPGEEGVPTTILDVEGHFSGELEDSGAFSFDAEKCVAPSLHITISGTMTQETLTMDIQNVWIDIEQNPSHDPCSFIGQTCVMTGEFTGTAD